MDKVEASFESQSSSSTNESKESRDDSSSSGNGIPSQSYQVPASVPVMDMGVTGDGLPPKTLKNSKGRRNRNSTKCHSMRTRNSKVCVDRGEQASKGDELGVEPTQWLEDALAKVIEKGIVLGANFKPNEGSQEEVLIDSQGEWHLDTEVVKIIELGKALGFDFRGRQEEVAARLSERIREDENLCRNEENH